MTETVPSAAAHLGDLVAIWRRACDDFVALARELPEDTWDLPTDLTGWTVKDNVAHTAHLEAVLAGAPEETVPVEPAAHIKGLTGFYTEQGVLARRDHTMSELVDELEQAVDKRHAELQANPPTDPAAAPPKTPGDVPWNNGTLLGNRPLDVWMHEQDIRRATGRPGGYDSPAAEHTLHRLAAGLPMVLGKRVGAPAGTVVRLDVPEAGATWSAAVGDDGRAALVADAEAPDARISLSAEDFVVLAGGRRGVDATDPKIEGDADLAGTLLAALAVTP